MASGTGILKLVVASAVIVAVLFTIRFSGSNLQEQPEGSLKHSALKNDDYRLAEAVRAAATANKQYKFHRVTEKPHENFDGAINADACRPSSRIRKQNPHQSFYVHVYVNERALEPMNSGVGKYPVGSLIIKQKFSDENGLNAELFTVMQKMEAGYNPDHGDWEYSVLDAAAKTVLSRGKTDSCIDCHDSYQSTDYVTRMYMPEK